MDELNLEILLKRMGYQTKLVNEKEVWYKPVAYMLFTIKDHDTALLGEVWIINNQGELSCFNKEIMAKCIINSVEDIQDFETELYNDLFRFSSTQSYKLVP